MSQARSGQMEPVQTTRNSASAGWAQDFDGASHELNLSRILLLRTQSNQRVELFAIVLALWWGPQDLDLRTDSGYVQPPVGSASPQLSVSPSPLGFHHRRHFLFVRFAIVLCDISPWPTIRAASARSFIAAFSPFFGFHLLPFCHGGAMSMFAAAILLGFHNRRNSLILSQAKPTLAGFFLLSFACHWPPRALFCGVY